jgi:sortase A
VRRAIAGLGRILVTLGLLILLFVAYQLWGTGIFTARAQASLEDDFEAAQDAYAAAETTTTLPADDPTLPGPDTTTPTTAARTFAAELPPLVEGEQAGHIVIPKIGSDWYFVEGTSRQDLKKGPGHYPGTPMPGQVGNAAIAGHRTTYGAPFNRLDELAPGDEIIITTWVGEYTYKVRDVPFAVEPAQTEVVQNTPDSSQLTLTTCHPKFSARERLIVVADLVVQESSPPTDGALFHGEEPAPAIEPDALSEGLEGEQKSLGLTYQWGAIAAVVGLAWWWFFRRWRHPLTWVVGVIPFLAVLFGFFVYLERALPAGI